MVAPATIRPEWPPAVSPVTPQPRDRSLLSRHQGLWAESIAKSLPTPYLLTPLPPTAVPRKRPTAAEDDPDIDESLVWTASAEDDEEELDDECEGDGPGFVFRYFSPGPLGMRRETNPTKDSLQAEEVILQRVSEVLADRPELLKRLCCLENGVEVRLHQGQGFRDEELEVYFFGRTTVHGDDAILEFATDEVLYGGREEHADVMDVIVHELTHLIDYLDDDDGVLPGWTPKDRHAFEQARSTEWTKLKTGQATPLVSYALTNDVEFLAVLAEVYWVKPKALKLASPVLFQLMDKFFHPKQ